MSMYNMMHGKNPFADILLATLGFTSVEQIPRLRDAYVDHENNIVVFTRTGGGNRDSYVDENTELQQRDGFLRTEDWETDSTYAKWVYAPPEGTADLVRQLGDCGARMDPTQQFQALMADLGSSSPKPSTRLALERIQPVLEQLGTVLAGRS